MGFNLEKIKKRFVLLVQDFKKYVVYFKHEIMYQKEKKVNKNNF